MREFINITDELLCKYGSITCKCGSNPKMYCDDDGHEYVYACYCPVCKMKAHDGSTTDKAYMYWVGLVTVLKELSEAAKKRDIL